MKRLRNILALSICLISSISTYATEVVDSENGLPIVGATVTDRDGVIVAITDANGSFSDETKLNYPISIRNLGYTTISIAAPQSTVEMTMFSYELPEVVVASTNKEVMRQVCYIREYMSITADNDTSVIFVEQMVDNFIPLKKVKGYKGRKDPRVLAQRSYGRFKDKDGRDSLTNNVDMSELKAMPIPWDVNQECNEVAALSGKANGVATKSGKSAPEYIYIKNSKTYTVVNDMLATTKDHKFSAAILRLMGLNMTITDITSRNVYNLQESGTYNAEDIRYVSFSFAMNAKGRLIRKASNSNSMMYGKIYTECYPVRREYMTADEAKELDSKKQTMKIEVPSTASALDASTQKLVNDVENGQN
jgi:hypothetical protein